MQKKTNLVFDITILVVNRKKDGCRSGIYFTAANILDEIYKREEFNLSFYCDKKLIPHIKETDILSKYNCPVINYDDLTAEDWKYLELKTKKLKYKESKNGFMKSVMSAQIFLFSLKNKIFNKTKLDLSKYDKVNAFFSPCYRIPQEIRGISHVKKFTLLHDTIPLILPEYFEDVQKGNSWYLKLKDTINKDDFYFTNSECTKNDFIKYVPEITTEHITTALLACADSFKPEKEKVQDALRKYNLAIDKKYIFSLCTLEPRKNLIRAVKCFIEFINKNNIGDLVFILGGGSWKGFIEQLEKEVPQFDKYRDKIIKAGYIDDEDLAPLYSGAEWFVYTSQYEGFGLPPLEAMSCGCPVIASNNSSLPEVVGNAGITIDWDNDEQHVSAYEKYYFDKAICAQNGKKGLVRAREFSWAKCADIMTQTILKESQND